jgi:F-type H+-transporting ATPase subunit delta
LASTAQSKRYAQAVFQIALQTNDFDRWLSDMKVLVSLEENQTVVQALETPIITTADKTRLLKDRFPGVGPLAINLVGILIERGRLRLLAGIQKELQALVDAYRGIEKADVTTAVELNEEDKVRLQKRLSAVTGKNVIINTKVDPSLIGGVVARFNGTLLDASTRSRLEALKKEISQAPG